MVSHLETEPVRFRLTPSGWHRPPAGPGNCRYPAGGFVSSVTRPGRAA